MKAGAQILGLSRAVQAMSGVPVHIPGAVVLGYHDVQPLDAVATDYTVTPELLLWQLTKAQQWGLSFVCLPDLTRLWLAGRSVDGLASVVFDDALVGVHRYAAGILADLHIPGTLFPLTRGLGERPSWWAGSARTMTAKENTELLDLGWSLGSHTHTHDSLPTLDPERHRSEIIGSREELEDATGRPVTTIAYPFGHHDERVRQVCREAGYEAGFTFLTGRVTNDLNAFKLPRLTMTMSSTGLRWAYHLTRSAASWPDTQLDAVEGREM